MNLLKGILVLLGIAFVITMVVHVNNTQKANLVEKNKAANPGIDWTAERVAALMKLSKQELQDCLDGKINIQIQ